MTQPREVNPGSVVLLTRRTVRRHYLLRPDREMTQLYLYVFGHFAKKYGMRVHALALMSTHKHDVITDVHGLRPRFVAELHRVVALGVKVLRKWEGAVWDERETSVVELRTLEAIIEEIAYVIANPVEAGAVEFPEQWPGICTTVDDLGRRVYRVRRPDFYFDPDNPAWPDEVEIPITVPQPLIDAYGNDEAVREVVRVEVDRRVAAAHQVAREQRRPFLGAAQVLKQSPYKRATSFEPLRARNPTFATGKGKRSAFFEAVARLRAFRNAYREAMAQWRRGVREAVFPPGTWAMVVLHGAIASPCRSG